jgi:broad specificity phosphatase PhoE
MASIYLVRHGQASFGTDDYDRLSDLGRLQARLAGEHLGAGHPAARIVSGAMRRQRETAEEIAVQLRDARGARPVVEIDPGLDELDLDVQFARILPLLEDDGGELATLVAQSRTSSSAYQKVIRRVFAHWQALPSALDGVESWELFSARAEKAVRDVVRQSRPGERSIMVSSGGVIAAIVQRLLGAPASSAYPLFEAMVNCSITHLLHDRERASLASFNDSTYLRAYGQLRGRALVTYR